MAREHASHNEQLVSDYVAMWNEREYSRFPDIVSESFTFTSPTAGTVQGRENVEAYVHEVIGGFSDFRITVHEVLADENRVVTESTLSGTHDGEFDGIPPTKNEFEIRDMAKFVIEDGKLQSERLYFDQYDLFRQLGLVDE